MRTMWKMAEHIEIASVRTLLGGHYRLSKSLHRLARPVTRMAMATSRLGSSLRSLPCDTRTNLVCRAGGHSLMESSVCHQFTRASGHG